MHRARGWWLDHRELPDQLLPDLGCAPGRVILLELHDRFLDLKRQLVGIPKRPATTILQADQAEVLVAIENLVAGLARDPEFPAHHRHLLAIEQAGNKLKTFIHTVTLIPGHLGIPQMPQCVTYVSGIVCNLGVGLL